MLQLTNEQKIDVLTKTKNRLLNSIDLFICHILWDILEEDYEINLSNENEVLNCVPEFLKEKPENAVFAWWDSDDKQSRIKALDNTIERLKKLKEYGYGNKMD